MPTKSVNLLVRLERDKVINHSALVAFLEKLQGLNPLPPSHVHRLGELYSLNTSTNCEIRFRWYGIALASEAGKDYAKPAAEWVVDRETGLKGRMKFCRPTFRAVYRQDAGLAKEVFKEHASEFHPIARRLIEKVCLFIFISVR